MINTAISASWMHIIQRQRNITAMMIIAFRRLRRAYLRVRIQMGRRRTVRCCCCTVSVYWEYLKTYGL